MKRRYLTVMLFALVAFGLAAQPVSVTINYENKQVYEVGSDILVKFTVRNLSATTYRFKLAQNRMFNVDLSVRNLTNQPLPPARQFTMERTSNQQIFYRDVALESEEEFSFVENLAHYVHLSDSGVYVVNAVFHPELVGSSERVPAANALSLTVRPPLSDTELVRARIDDRTLELLQREAIPPDEVVAWTVSAVQDRAWNRFFLYIDLEGLLLSNPARARSYRRLGDAEQRSAVAEYRGDLERAIVDPDLSAIPSEFTIVRTTYDPLEATVIVDQRFRNATFTERKRYTYFLRRQDRVWYIYDYAVTNLGAE